ncbi:hypothetical protein LZP97_27230 (plasmid) [Rhodococcus sp. DMF-1]|nr:hypothetical protein [Rhodococcus sp. DMF-1]UIR39780.1 hypothetical protein LZP97_27230 [Rhodococcus sp. DMF-1]
MTSLMADQPAPGEGAAVEAGFVGGVGEDVLDVLFGGAQFVGDLAGDGGEGHADGAVEVGLGDAAAGAEAAGHLVDGAGDGGDVDEAVLVERGVGVHAEPEFAARLGATSAGLWPAAAPAPAKERRCGVLAAATRARREQGGGFGGGRVCGCGLGGRLGLLGGGLDRCSLRLGGGLRFGGGCEAGGEICGGGDTFGFVLLHLRGGGLNLLDGLGEGGQVGELLGGGVRAVGVVERGEGAAGLGGEVGELGVAGGQRVGQGEVHDRGPLSGLDRCSCGRERSRPAARRRLYGRGR